MELKSLTILFFWILIGKNVHFLVIMLELFSAIRQKKANLFSRSRARETLPKYLKDAGWKIKDKMQIQ
jgi:hypothetical protein